MILYSSKITWPVSRATEIWGSDSQAFIDVLREIGGILRETTAGYVFREISCDQPIALIVILDYQFFFLKKQNYSTKSKTSQELIQSIIDHIESHERKSHHAFFLECY